MLIMMKQARLIFVNITEIVWGFTGGAGAKTVKYRLHEMAQHKSAAVKGDRSLVKDKFQYIKKITGKLIPVGSGNKVSYFLNILVFAFPKQLPVRISRVVKFPEREVLRIS